MVSVGGLRLGFAFVGLLLDIGADVVGQAVEHGLEGGDVGLGETVA